MSIEALNWALTEAAIPSPTPAGMPSAPALTMVLIGLANHASRTGEDAYPSVATLAAYARMSERQVQRCLAALLELGLIVLGDQRIVAAKIQRADRRPISYQLMIQRGDEPSPRPESRGDKRVTHGATSRRRRGDSRVTRTVLEPKDETAAGGCVARSAPRGRPKRNNAAAATPTDNDLAPLAERLRSAGLTASFGKLDDRSRSEVADLVGRCGIDAMVASARAQHQPQSPARFVQAWLPTWRELPDRSSSKPKCSGCDEFGWLPDDEQGRAVRCGCRR